MKILAILAFCLLALSTPILARGSRCRSSTQCDFQSVCDEGYCMTIDEMFAKYDKPSSNRKNSNNGWKNGGLGGNNGFSGRRRYYELNNYE